MPTSPHAVRTRISRRCALISALALFTPALYAQDPALLTRNRTLGAPLSPYDARVSPYSPVGARNPYASAPPVVRYETRASETRARSSSSVWERVDPPTRSRSKRP